MSEKSNTIKHYLENMKRTNKYGCFLIGDRVRYMHTEGEVVGLKDGNIIVEFHNAAGACTVAIMPNQLINLTQEKELWKELNAKFENNDIDRYSLGNVLKDSEQTCDSVDDQIQPVEFEETDLLKMNLRQIKDLKKEIASKVEKAVEDIVTDYEKKYHLGYIAVNTSRYMDVFVTECGEELSKEPKHETEITFTREEE